MSRLDTIRKLMLQGSRGIEIGPWRNPIAPKRDGFQTLVIDILGTNELREKARRMNAPDAQVEGIEEVDLVGDASRLLELVRGHGVMDSFDWIVSSHNFEHLPDPIRFLSDCESLLKPGGFLGMIIPDKRQCFDRFRPSTNIADLVRAHLDSASSKAAAFAMFALQALRTTLLLPDGTECQSWKSDIKQPEQLRTQDIRAKYDLLKNWLALDPVPKFAGHRWQFSPAAFELAMLDLRAIGLANLNLEEIVLTEGGGEFAVLLRLGAAIEMSSEAYKNLRSELCRRIEDEAASVTGHCLRLENELAVTRAELAEAKSLVGRLNDSHPNDSCPPPG
jgi:SAM-dependent methyltransferase